MLNKNTWRIVTEDLQLFLYACVILNEDRKTKMLSMHNKIQG